MTLKTYHLRRQGEDLGISTLQDLRRRHASGEFTGDEYVWCVGMPNWHPLRLVLLEETGPQSLPPPLPAPAPPRTTNHAVIWVVVAAVVAFLGVAIYKGFTMAGYWQHYVNAIDPQPTRHYRSHGPGNDVAVQPILVKTNTLTGADIEKRFQGYRTRHWLTIYQQSPTADSVGIGFLSQWISNRDGAGEELTLAQYGDKVAADPHCNDPLLLTIAAATGVELFSGTHRLERALDLYPQFKYPAYPQFYTYVLLGNYSRQLNDLVPRQVELDRAAVELFKRALSDGSIRTEDQEEIANILIHGWGDNFFKRKGKALIQVTTEAGSDFTWLALVLEGDQHIDAAWKARGSGYANSVTPTGWSEFNTHLAEARTALTRAWELSPERPIAAGCMMTVALGQSDVTEMRLWFDRAVAVQIDYPSAWKSMRYGLLPRWYGNREALKDFGITALNTERYDSDAPRQFFDSVTDLEGELELKTGEHIYGRADIWPSLQRMYEGYINEPKQKQNQAGWRTAYATVAYLGGKYNVARAQLEALHWQPRTETLNQWHGDFSLMAAEVAARTSPVGAAIKDAETSYQQKDSAAALTRFKGLSLAPGLDELTKAFINTRITSLNMEAELAKGEWVKFQPTMTGDLNWIYSRGKFRPLPDGSLEVSSDANGHMLVCRSRVGPRFEVKGEFEVVSSSTRDFQAGLVIGQPDFDGYDWYSFRMKRNQHEGQVITYARHWGKNQLLQPLPLNDVTNSFYFRYDETRATASVNGTQVFEEAIPRWEIDVAPADTLLGLGAFNDVNDTVIRYRNIQVRRLSTPTRTAAKQD